MTTQLLLLAAFVASMILMSFNYKKKKKRILFFGDSITEQGTQRMGYISMIKDLVREVDLEEKYELIASGIGGNKVYDLYQRMEKDVINRWPDVVVIFAGVNDAWGKKLTGHATSKQMFEEYYNAIVDRLKSAGIKVVLCTIGVIGEKTDGNEMDDLLEEYCSIISLIATKQQVELVDLRSVFQLYIAQNNPFNQEKGIATRDGVHLNDKGNELLATALWERLSSII